jgi:hypothetical protein
LQIFADFSTNRSRHFRSNFYRILPGFRQISDNYQYFLNFVEKFQKFLKNSDYEMFINLNFQISKYF